MFDSKNLAIIDSNKDSEIMNDILKQIAESQGKVLRQF